MTPIQRSKAPGNRNFTQRTWTLLKLEIDENIMHDVSGPRMKVINLEMRSCVRGFGYVVLDEWNNNSCCCRTFPSLSLIFPIDS
jgi:hypothetical protein